MNFIYQGNNSDCGFAALKMLLCYYQKDRNYLYLEKDNNKKGDYSLLDLTNIAKSEEVELEGFQDYSKEDILNLKKPFLATIKENELNHMVFIRKIIKNRMVVYDPDKGPQFIKIDVFMQKFTGIVLIVNSVNSKKCTSKKKRIYPLKNILLLYSAQIISLCLFFAALSTIGFKTSEYITLTLLIAYIIVEFMYETLLSKSFKQFDNTYVPLIKQKNDYISRQEALFNINEYKKCIYGRAFECITSIMILFSIALSCIINGNIYFIVLAIISLFVALFYIFINPKISKDKEKIMKQEHNVLTNNGDDIIPYINTTYSIVSFLTLKRYLFIILSVAASVILMMITKQNELNFVIFYFFMFVLALDKLSVVLTYSLESGKRKKLDAEFRDMFL